MRSTNACPEGVAEGSCRQIAHIIGGGITGCTVAYHLAEEGCDVVLLERDQLTSGTTWHIWHAAGLLTTYGSGWQGFLSVLHFDMICKRD